MSRDFDIVYTICDFPLLYSFQMLLHSEDRTVQQLAAELLGLVLCYAKSTLAEDYMQKATKSLQNPVRIYSFHSKFTLLVSRSLRDITTRNKNLNKETCQHFEVLFL